MAGVGEEEKLVGKLFRPVYRMFVLRKASESGPGGGYSHTEAIRGRAALQGMDFRPSTHKHGLKFKDFRRFFILNRV